MIEKSTRDARNSTWDHPDVDPDRYDTVRDFINRFGCFPNNSIYIKSRSEYIISYDKLVSEIKNNDYELLTKSTRINGDPKHIYYRVGESFFLLESISDMNVENCLDVPNNIINNGKVKNVGMVTIMFKTEDIPEDMFDIFDKCKLIPKKTPKISIISRDQSGYFLNDMNFDTGKCGDLDLHYSSDNKGRLFSEFHNTFVDKIVSSKGGIALLHGEPGTGKSSYIRNLISDLKKKTNKKIVFVPSNLVESIADPDFISFLIDEIEGTFYDGIDEQDDGEYDGMIMILEEAQNAISKRENDMSKQSTNNILNLTEGILNDIFSIQIIATYNTKDSNIDPAIKREMRLMADKYFGILPLENTKKLAKHIGVTEDIYEPMVVSKIYSLLSNETNDILIDRPDTKPTVGLI